jgi:hypothetical protein
MRIRPYVSVVSAILVISCGYMSVRRAIAQQAVEQRFDQLDRNGD